MTMPETPTTTSNYQALANVVGGKGRAKPETMLDRVANDLALWLDQESTRIAAAMAPQGVSPFSAGLSEEQKLQYYRDQLFNTDGSPNMTGRAQTMARLGPQSFTMVYKAVIKAYPNLRLPTPPGMPGGPGVQVAPPPPPSGVPVPMVPRGLASAQVPNITPIVPPNIVPPGA